MKSDSIPIPERLKVLERKYKSMQIISFSAILLMGALLFTGAAKKEEISDLLLAKELQIVDEAGNKRIRIGKADAGYGVVIFDEQGSFNATLTDAPVVLLFNYEKKVAALNFWQWTKGVVSLLGMEKDNPLLFL